MKPSRNNSAHIVHDDRTDTKVRSLEIDELVVRHLRVTEELQAPTNRESES